jgi:diguanylate cyclase (GGDEF)-like protein
MTLLKQLLVMIVLLFVMLFAGTFTLSIQNTRAYLNNQLKTISQDTATSLGLSLSPHISKKDFAVVERMVSAVSDSGYYREVVVTDVEGKDIVSKIQQVNLDNVPKWFIERFPLETPLGEALIMDGWQQGGLVKVLANPGYAYAALWTSAVQSFWWFAGMSVLACLLGAVALHFILRPLRAVEAQAKAICNREYPVQSKIPWTLELRSVVEAMNRMTTKVKEMFEEQAASIQRLRTENYRDALTNLANRRYFEMQLKQLIETGKHGAVLLLELKDFKQYNEKHGYQAGDELLRNTAGFIEAICKAQHNLEYFTTHMSGANFAVVTYNTSEQEASELGNQLARSLPRFKERGLIDTEEAGHIGIALFSGQKYSEVLSAADLALRTAQQEGPNTMHLIDPGKSGANAANTSVQWGEILREALHSRRLSVLLQPLKDATDPDHNTILHYESLMRLTDEKGEVIPAVVYTQMAKRHGLCADFDMAMITEVLARLVSKRYGEMPIAVNIFPAGLQNKEFVDWLCANLAKVPDAASRLLIEIPEYGVIENIDALSEFIGKLSMYGTRVGLDHFGRGFSSFGYLSKLKLGYVKVDGSYVRGILENKDNQFFIESVTKVAHGLDIKVYAVSVETEAEWSLLTSLRLDGVQGFGVGRPQSI